MKWIRPSQATIDYFERLAPGAPLETRRMFGMPCRFLNGYMLVGVFQNTLMLHLSAEDRAACIKAGAQPFKPMGRDMKAYVAIAPGTFEDHDLKWWIVRGMRYLGSLEPRLGDGAPASRARGTAKATTAARSPSKAKVKKKSGGSRKVAPKPVTKKAARKATRPTKKAPKRRTPPSNKKRPAKKRGRRR